MITIVCSGKTTPQVIAELQKLANISGDQVEIKMVTWNGNEPVKTIAKHIEEMRGLASDERVMRR